ncbi:MAG: putative Ig domain-containing protein, partial [Runella sp.]
MNQPIHQFTFLKLRFVPFVVGLLMTGLLINNFQVLAQIPEDKQRYVGLQLLNLDPKPQYGLDIIENSIRQGCNLVEISIYWDEVYKKVNDQPFWEQSDRQMELISRLGAKAAIRIMLGRKLERLEGFWTEKETMKDFLGRPLSSAYGRTCFSFAHPPTVNKAFGFVQEVLRRYNTYQQQGKLLFVTFVNTPTQELGYHYETDPDGVYEKRYTTAFDYSQPSTDAFVDWLTAKYKRVNKLNYLWGTQFATFRDVRTPNTSYFPLPAYRTRGGKDWYLFMHLLLKEYIQKGIKVIKEVNPNFKVVSEYGAVCDVKSAIRGTIAFRDLDQNTDGTKVHDDLYYNHRFIADVVRTNRPGKWVMNEVFYTNDSPVDLLIRHFDESFENGCQVVVMVVSTVEENARRVFENVSRWKNIPYQEVVPTVSMTYKVTEVLDSTITLFEKKWKEIVPKSGLPTVAVKLEEDILTDEYWKPLTVNVHPVVVNPIPERASKVRRQFSYTLPRDVFKDPDGDIVRIEVIEKPAWLNFNGSVFSGTTPDQVAEHRITLRATDDEGATVTTSFTLRVTNVNIKPIVRRPLPDFEGFLEQYLYYQLHGDHFDDPDGTIVRIQAVAGLRPWMTFNGREFGAFPKEQGTFTVTLRATDDDSAWVETSFKVKIINRSPIVRTPLPEKIIAQNKAFRFRIPANTFSDPDGEIVRLRVFNLPTWLTFDGNELRGTPTDLGTYRLIVRAYDNGGDSTQTPFVIKVDERNVVNMPP